MRDKAASVYYDEYSFEKVIQDQIALQTEADLLPIREDLADWLTKISGISVSEKNFLKDLDNGVVLIKMAQYIQNAIREYYLSNKSGQTLETLSLNDEKLNLLLCKKRLNCKLNAQSGSFFARDNIVNFLKWFKLAKSNDNYIFDIEDLINHRRQKILITCVLETSRLAQKFNDKLIPNILLIESDVEKQAKELNINEYETLTQDANQLIPINEINELKQEIAYDETQEIKESMRDDKIVNSEKGDGEQAKGDNKAEKEVEEEVVEIMKPLIKQSPADIKIVITINDFVQKCKCKPKIKAFQISQGYYSVCGRNIFIRILNDKYYMVRVGGGWIELESFLNKRDPCRKSNHT